MILNKVKWHVRSLRSHSGTTAASLQYFGKTTTGQSIPTALSLAKAEIRLSGIEQYANGSALRQVKTSNPAALKNQNLHVQVD